jgi:CHAD domain-containing protein
VRSHREIEHTYDPPADAVLPDLTRLDGVLTVETGPEHELEATYYDTAGQDLFTHQVTLRRRAGGTDEGWHLKLPAGAETREEVRLPLARARRGPPKELRDLVLALTRGEPLSPMATLRTRRTETALRGDTGILARVADDRVDAYRTLPGDEPRLLSWREWEFELVDGGPALLDAADTLLAEVGAGVARVPTKLGRVLGDAAPVSPGGKRPHAGKPVARVLHAYLVAQVEQVLAADRAVRRRESDGIHDLRVAFRRLRSTLATYRSLVEREVTDPLRDEMRWASHTLGTARDAEVVRQRLQSLLGGEAAGGPASSARAELVGAGRADAREARSLVEETLRSARYLAVIDVLHRLVADPPWTKKAGRTAGKVLPKLLAKDLSRLRKRVRRTRETNDEDERAQRVHDVRKAAKRLRYACEAARPALGPRVAAVETGAEQIQTVLGDHHDTRLTRAALLDLAAVATPQAAFTLGRLHAREEAEATRLEGVFLEAWSALKRQVR